MEKKEGSIKTIDQAKAEFVRKLNDIAESLGYTWSLELDGKVHLSEAFEKGIKEHADLPGESLDLRAVRGEAEHEP